MTALHPYLHKRSSNSRVRCRNTLKLYLLVPSRCFTRLKLRANSMQTFHLQYLPQILDRYPTSLPKTNSTQAPQYIRNKSHLKCLLPSYNKNHRHRLT